MKSRKQITIFASLLVLIASIFIGSFHVTLDAQPGSQNDPLVTQRFVEDRIATLTAEINQLRNIIHAINPDLIAAADTDNFGVANRDQLFADFIIYFEAMYGDLIRQAGLSTDHAPGEDMPPQDRECTVVPFTPVLIPAGRTLRAHAGVEFIVRGGQATVISGVDGLVDVTAGFDRTNGQTIPLNHLMLVPRTDGRGLRAVTDTWVMIKGIYEII